MENPNDNQFKFFIVDDDVFCASMHEQYLRNLNYEDITYYDNGNDCLNNLDKNPDIIFLDHNMDGMTGFDVLKKIKRTNPNIFVVMVSGQDNIKTAVDALKYGAFDYVIKDTNVSDKMAIIIDKIIKVKEELRKKNPSLFQRIISNF
ncbi:response regulator [Flavobacterium branchiophilum]|uniref:Response regulator n=2 Tax=Flavobacterium branchiophilum TaxID=55197 RepID=A0A2H3KAK7_9FLAO|nr:response regulator [Flavobacterium branchiophilum]OXA76992.1 response regulator [Flavobacterium branchiophilum] [Flavobacterium branchiophilum NBRC 15030 = ATCC 35035]PDS23733.1 response regulator [Flavobacterium branchiophilum]TQM39549.1 response regulator receiver domain-containing protein [Flavobacterium branchiophilum]CCB70280.1 Probable two-component system response regulatory protein [Flavobacterium branchiophilum FL-15]